MAEKLATHDVQDVSELFRLGDKCARAVEGHVWHSQLAPKARKKKASAKDKPLVDAPTTAAATTGGGRGPRGDKRPRLPSDSDVGG
jgi:hypothetical protein